MRALGPLGTGSSGTEVDLVVVGAHLRGQPLNGELGDLGGTFVGPVTTAATYRLWALATEPPKPGLVRVRSGGSAVHGEHWRLPVCGFGAFVASLRAPMTIGSVALDDGRALPGFLVEASALDDPAAVQEITAYGSWPAYLAAREADRPSRSSIRASRAATAASLPWSVGT